MNHLLPWLVLLGTLLGCSDQELHVYAQGSYQRSRIPPTTMPITDMLLVIDGVETGDNLGYAVDAGDLDADGDADLILGAPQLYGSDGPIEDASRGRVYLMSGILAQPTSVVDAVAVLEGSAPQEHAGISVTYAGDINTDGVGDLAVGTQYSNRVYVITGPVEGRHDLADISIIIEGDASSYHAGISLDGDADVDGDGVVDLLIGNLIIEQGVRGEAYIVHGPLQNSASIREAQTVIGGTNPCGSNLWHIASAGDVDGDGTDDVLLGFSCSEAAGDPIVSLFTGPLSGSIDLQDAAATLLVPDGSGVGISTVSRGGDLDGDGLADIVVAAEHINDHAGAVYIEHAPPRSELSVDQADACAGPD